jgi:hypothetical protein
MVEEIDKKKHMNFTEENTKAPPSKDSTTPKGGAESTLKRNPSEQPKNPTPIQVDKRRESNVSKSPIQRRGQQQNKEKS